MKHSSLLLALTVVLAGCGWESDGERRLADRFPDTAADDAIVAADTAAEADAAADVAVDEATPQDADPGDATGAGLAGRWAVQVVVKGTMSPIGTAWAYTETSWFLADITEGSATASWIYCDQVNDVPKAPNPTAQPKKLYDLLVSKPLEVSLSADGLAAGAVVWTWGLDGQKLGNPQVKPTGITKTSDAVIDEDDDGQVGVTLSVLKKADGSLFASRYLARWERWELQAGSLSDDGKWMEGALAADAVEFALGADNALVDRASNLVVDPGVVHGWRMRRVGAGYSCASLKQDAATLFIAP